MKTSVVLDEKSAVNELQEIIAIPSITGSEKILAADLAKRLEQLGAEDVVLQEGVEDKRQNTLLLFQSR